MKKLILWLYRKFVRVSIPDTFNPKVDITKYKEPQLLKLRAGCKAIVNDGSLAEIVSSRANAIRKHITLESPDYHDVELHRVRLFELASLTSEIARLARPEQHEVEFNKHSIF